MVDATEHGQSAQRRRAKRNVTQYRSPWLDSDLDAVRDLARAFFENQIKPNMDKFIEQHHVDRDLWNEAGELGLLCTSIPEEYGGGGGTFAHEAVLIEEQSRIGDCSWGAPLHSGIVAPYLLAYGTEAQKQAWLPRMASGETVGAIAMTEPGTGSDLQGIKTRAAREGDEYVINGSKTFITNGAQADLVVVAAQTRGADESAGISLFLVEGDREGFRRGRVLDKIGQRGQDTSELFFEDVRVPASNLLGAAEGQGFVQLMQQLPQERLIIGVGSVALMEAALEATLQYTKERHAFGKPIISFQNTKFTLAEVATDTKIGRVFIDYCIEQHIKGQLDVPTVAMAKWWTTERAMAVLDECLQLHGGYGYMTEYPISRMWVDNRVQKIYAGTNEIMKEIIARTF